MARRGAGPVARVSVGGWWWPVTKAEYEKEETMTAQGKQRGSYRERKETAK